MSCVLLSAPLCRRSSRYRSGSLTRCERASKRGLLVLNLQKPTAPKALQMRSLSAFVFETITLRNLEKNLYEANASVKRNTSSSSSSFFIARFSVRVAGAVAQD